MFAFDHCHGVGLEISRALDYPPNSSCQTAAVIYVGCVAAGPAAITRRHSEGQCKEPSWPRLRVQPDVMGDTASSDLFHQLALVWFKVALFAHADLAEEQLERISHGSARSLNKLR